jgi:hypothetical protein
VHHRPHPDPPPFVTSATHGPATTPAGRLGSHPAIVVAHSSCHLPHRAVPG